MRRLGAFVLCGGMLGLVGVPEAAQAAVSVVPDATWGVEGDGLDGAPPPPDARVSAIAVTNERIYIGGDFTRAVSSGGPGATVVARSNLIALNAVTGALDTTFNPAPSGPVRALAVADGRLYVGGRFVQIGGGNRSRFAALDPVTGTALADFRADVDNPVWTIEVGGGRVYAGGLFHNVTDSTGTSSHRHLVAVDPVTGHVDQAFQAGTDDIDDDGNPLTTDDFVQGFVRSLKLSPDRSRLYVGGDFLSINGVRRESLAAVMASNGALDLAFDPRNPPRAMALAVDGSRLYAAYGGGGGQARAHNLGTGREIWRVRGNGDFQGIAVIGNIAYVGGHFGEENSDNAAFAGVFRSKLAAVNATTGALDPFDPQLNSALGVWALIASGSTLHVGGDFTRVGTTDQPHYARFPALPEPPAAPTAVTAIPGDGSATVTWVAPLTAAVAPITSYRVTPSRDGVAQGPIDYPANPTTQTITGLTNGVPYTFTVTATNAIGTSPPSAPSPPVIPTTVPSAPPAPTAQPADGRAEVTWTPPADDGGSPLVGYVLTPIRNGVAEPSLPFPASVTTTTVTGLVNGSEYRFTVAASNGGGTGPPSAPSAPIRPRTVPGTPLGVTAAAANQAAVVSWQPPAFDGGSPVTGYAVTPYRNGVALAPQAIAGPETTGSVTGLDNGIPYTFTVVATNDAGSGPASAQSNAVSPRLPSGYWMVGSDGRVYTFGQVPNLGGPVGAVGPGGAVDLEPVPTLDGYWIVDAGGRVYSYGEARHLGGVEAGRLQAGERVTSLSGTRTGAGYWMFTTEGRVFAFGDAEHFGDMGGTRLNAPVLDSIATPSGRGYYMVAGDGGIFTFGDAAFAGSMGGQRLNAPVESMVPDGDGRGYWLVASDGGVFAFDALFRGSMGAVPLNRPITGMVRFGNGYLMVAEDGGIFNFSDWAFRGSLGSDAPARSIVSIAAAG